MSINVPDIFIRAAKYNGKVKWRRGIPYVVFKDRSDESEYLKSIHRDGMRRLGANLTKLAKNNLD